MNALGIDVGATTTRAAIVEVTTGRIERIEASATGSARGGSAVLANCVALAQRVAEATSIGAVAVGVCELVDLTGRVTSSYSFDWRDLDVASAFGTFGRAHVESDVRAAARAEVMFGAGRALETFLYVNAGSGISSAFVVGGQPHAGTRGNAILIGAGPLDVEEVAGGVAIARAAGTATADEAERRAAAGDRRASQALTAGGTALGNAIAFAVNLLDPAAVVLGGGVALGSQRFRDALVERLRQQIWSDETRDLPVLDADLGGNAGVIGAALVGAESVAAVLA